MAKTAGTNKSAEPAETAEPGGSTGSDSTRAESVIPWGYGVDRVKAMAVDPERLFVYWEVTDAAIEKARGRLGTSGAAADLVLRVYDISGRIFDGTNAHSHFDQLIERGDRQWFFGIDKPTSEVIVEIGLGASEREFVKIVRSGRAEFPRASPREPTSPQWLTVRLQDGAARLSDEHVNSGSDSGHAETSMPRFEERPELPAPGNDGPSVVNEVGVETVPAWTEQIPLQTRTEQTRVFRREGDWTRNSWEAGPFTTDVGVEAPWTECFAGGVRTYRHGPETRVVLGPWEVVIRGLGAQRRRAVLGRWEIHRSWITEEGRELRYDDPVEGALLAGSSAAFGRGASERRWQAGSELRLGGASELLYAGASERRFLSASEWLVRGASERRLGGASERALRGASERRLGGASEGRLGGASEGRLGGASEGRLGGASERRPRTVGKSAYPSVAGEEEVS